MPLKPYDLLREGLVVFGFVLIVVVVLSIVFKAPDYPTVNAQNVATAQPLAFLQTAAGVLANDSSVSLGLDYGPPYDDDSGAAQHIGPIAPAAWAKDIFGVTIPIDPPRDLIIKPLRRAAALDPALGLALDRYTTATPQQQAAGLTPTARRWRARPCRGATVTCPRATMDRSRS